MTDLASNALVTLADFKQFMHIDTDDVDDDGRLTQVINYVSQRIERYCKRVFKSAAYTEYYDGVLDMSSLILNQYPVSAISSIYDDPSWYYTADSLILATDYAYDADSGMVFLAPGYRFSMGKRNIKITYTAGYSTIPADLANACCEWCALEYQRISKERWGLNNISAANTSTGFDNSDIPDNIKLMLTDFVRKATNATYTERT